MLETQRSKSQRVHDAPRWNTNVLAHLNVVIEVAFCLTFLAVHVLHHHVLLLLQLTLGDFLQVSHLRAEPLLLALR
jgi:hypothetical protein